MCTHRSAHRRAHTYAHSLFLILRLPVVSISSVKRRCVDDYYFPALLRLHSPLSNQSPVFPPQHSCLSFSCFAGTTRWARESAINRPVENPKAASTLLRNKGVRVPLHCLAAGSLPLKIGDDDHSYVLSFETLSHYNKC